MKTLTFFTKLANGGDILEHPTKEAAHQYARTRSLEMLQAHLNSGGEVEDSPRVYLWISQNDLLSSTESWHAGVCYGPHGIIDPFANEGLGESFDQQLQNFLENY